MKLDEAIEQLDTLLNDYHEEPCPNETDALKLGIEAMKRLQEARKKVYFTSRTLLPGETTD